MALVRVYEDGKPRATRDYFAMIAQRRRRPASGVHRRPSGHDPARADGGAAGIPARRGPARARCDGRVARRADRVPGQRGPEQARTGAGELFGVENSYKALRGQCEALLDPAFVERKRAERDGAARLRRRPIRRSQRQRRRLGRDRRRPTTLARPATAARPTSSAGPRVRRRAFAFARTLVRGAAERAKPNDDRLPEFNDSRAAAGRAELLSPAPIYPALEKLKLTFADASCASGWAPTRRSSRRVLGKESPEQIAAGLVAGTKLGDPAVRRRSGRAARRRSRASDDPMIRLAAGDRSGRARAPPRYERDVEAVDPDATPS